MELRYLEIFCKVVENRSFSKAAKALYLTQPTVSIHIKALEEEFATRLLDRFGRTVKPTRAGEILYKYAKDIVRLKEEARLAMDQFSGKMRGKLIIGASTIPGEYILPSLLGRFRVQFPDVHPTLKVSDTGEVYSMVLEGTVDLGVVGSAIKDKNIISKEFLEDELTLVATPDFKDSELNIKDIKNVPLIQREVGSGSRASLEGALKNKGVEVEGLSIIGEMGSTQALIQAVKSGMGLSFISKLAVLRDIEQGNLKGVRVKDLRIKRHFYIITHRLKVNSPISKTFIEYLLKK